MKEESTRKRRRRREERKLSKRNGAEKKKLGSAIAEKTEKKQQPTRLLSNELRDQPEGKVTRWAAFCVFWEDCLVSERVFMPDCTYFLVPELTEPGRGAEVCLVSKRMFIPDDTPVLVKKYYILTQKNKCILNMVACSATSVESCLCLKVPRASAKGRLLL